MSKTRDNHYVPEWYQRGFLFDEKKGQLRYLDFEPYRIPLPDGRTKEITAPRWMAPSQCFYQTDLYTTFFGSYVNDEIERFLFGDIDTKGSRAVRAFIGDDYSEWHHCFEDFFAYIDAQKIRTPKGLQWIRESMSCMARFGLSKPTCRNFCRSRMGGQESYIQASLTREP